MICARLVEAPTAEPFGRRSWRRGSSKTEESIQLFGLDQQLEQGWSEWHHHW